MHMLFSFSKTKISLTCINGDHFFVKKPKLITHTVCYIIQPYQMKIILEIRNKLKNTIQMWRRDLKTTLEHTTADDEPFAENELSDNLKMNKKGYAAIQMPRQQQDM